MAQALYVYAHTKHNGHQYYFSVIVLYPGTVAPLNQTRLNKANVHQLDVSV